MGQAGLVEARAGPATRASTRPPLAAAARGQALARWVVHGAPSPGHNARPARALCLGALLADSGGGFPLACMTAPGDVSLLSWLSLLPWAFITSVKKSRSVL